MTGSIPRLGPDVLLVDAKYPHNVGGALRACALLGAGVLFWSGSDVPDPEQWPDGARLPREERMRCYKRTRLCYLPNDGELAYTVSGQRWRTPVCVEIAPGAEDLRSFEHPRNALYIFGREDSSVPRWLRAECHRFVRIPNAIADGDPDGRTPYNVAAAVNIVLYDRLTKLNGTDHGD